MNSFGALVPRALGPNSANEVPVLTLLRALNVDYNALHLLTGEMIQAAATYQDANIEKPSLNVLLALQRVIELAAREDAQRKAKDDAVHNAKVAVNGGRNFEYRRDLRGPKSVQINNLQRFLRTSDLFDQFQFKRVGGPANGQCNSDLGT